MRTITVAKDSKGDYRTIGEALEETCKENTGPVKIYVHNGVYREKLLIQRPFLTLEGESAEGTLITYGDYARMVMPDGEAKGTFRTFTVMIDTHDMTMKNITIRNEAGSGSLVGQAIALYADGDRLEFEHCRILGYQDTLFTGPLPPSPLIEKGFTGPKEHAPRIHGKQYYKECYIEGNVDFIFGSATAYFEECEIFTRDVMPERIPEKEQEKMSEKAPDVRGYIMAPSTPSDKEYGYVFYHCRFTGDCPPGTVYLGRPWREYGKAVLISCYLGAHIKEEGWSDWGKEEARQTVFFGEYDSRGKGAERAVLRKRAPWSKELSVEESFLYRKDKVYGN